MSAVAVLSTPFLHQEPPSVRIQQTPLWKRYSKLQLSNPLNNPALQPLCPHTFPSPPSVFIQHAAVLCLPIHINT